jgi:radical SAM superfamily enzyme YgiQ (UPF0313 family)
MRFRSVDKLIEQAKQGLHYRKRIGLVGPAVADHPQIKEILVSMRQMGAGLSISSLRISSLSGDILSELAKSKAQTITIAPEAGSQRLRQVIKKSISDSDILEVVNKVAEQRFKQLKLYFMLGLPTETDEDVEGIIRMTLAAKDIIDKHQSGTRISLNMAPFVPKAGTPFQWHHMAPLPVLNRRLSQLKKSLPPKGIRVKAESPAWSQVQGVLARGNIEVAEVLASIEDISLSGWRKASEKCHLDVDYYVNQRWDTSRKLPWDIIDTGTRPGHLKSGLEKALKFGKGSI